MPDFPRAEQQSTINVLRDQKSAILAAKKRLDAMMAKIKLVKEISQQNRFYEQGIDSARGQMYKLIVAQLRSAEVVHADEYTAQLTSAMELLLELEKKSDAP